MMRRSRRNRKCPCRRPRLNRSRGGLPPSTQARWGWKLRIARWLSRMYPISTFAVEDVSAVTKPGQRKWNRSFSPLEAGKHWFYKELSKIAPVKTFKGYETKTERDRLGLKKLTNKMSTKFEAHCIDSWVLANMVSGGHAKPDNKEMTYMRPIRLHRRQLHVLQFAEGGLRRGYGGTRSLGFKRGTWVRHPKYKVCYVGGSSKKMLSLHDIKSGKRLTQSAKIADCQTLTLSSWAFWRGGAANSSAG